MSIDFNQLREFVTAIAQTEITELTLKSGELELTVRKEVQVVAPVVTAPLPTVQALPVAEVIPSPAVNQSQGANVPPTTEPPAPPAIDKKWVEITSPMVGTFYRAPAPGEAAFVEVGDRIKLGQVVCIIEAMKLMNEIEAEVSGQVMEIVVENGKPVEYGQTLMWVNPD